MHKQYYCEKRELSNYRISYDFQLEALFALFASKLSFWNFMLDCQKNFTSLEFSHHFTVTIKDF